MSKHYVLSLIALTTLGLLALAGPGRAVQTADLGSHYGNSSHPGTEQNSIIVTTQEAFLMALSAAHAPGGLVKVRKCGKEVPLVLVDPVLTPLRDAMDSITKRDPRYRWQNYDGLVNLMPSEGEPDLLKVRLKQYTANTNLIAALQQLFALREVKEESTRLGLKQNTLKIPGLGPPKNGLLTKVSLSVSDLTLLEALNALARADGSAVWGYWEYRCNGVNEFSIDFLNR